MSDEEKKRIEDYINNYRSYPPEYKGIRDKKIIHRMSSYYSYNVEEQTIIRLEGRINDNGDFKIVGLFKFPIGRPEEKEPFEFYPFEKISTGFIKLMNGLGYNCNIENWNIRDLVAEADYVRSTYYQKGHPNNNMRYSNFPEWNRRLARLYHFIRVYKPQIEGIECYTAHNSKYDNEKK